jgi:hypothetical protein
MEPNMWERLSDRDEAFTTIKMDQFMMENGLKTRDQAEERCFSKTVQSMMDNGSRTKSMAMESISQQMATAMKACST